MTPITFILVHKNPHGRIPWFATVLTFDRLWRGISVARCNRKSNNFLGKIAAAVYQHVAHLSNAGWNGVLHPLDTLVPPAIKHVAILTSHQADSLCLLYDNETRLNDTTLPANAIRANDKNKGIGETGEKRETYHPRVPFLCSLVFETNIFVPTFNPIAHAPT